MYFSTNAEKANSSVVKAVLFELRTNPISRDALGDSIREQKDDFFGQLWVNGQVSHLLLLIEPNFELSLHKASFGILFS